MRTVLCAILRPQTRRRRTRTRSSRHHKSQHADPSTRRGTHTCLHSKPNIPASKAHPHAGATPRLQAPSNNHHRRRPNTLASKDNPPPDKAAVRIPAEPVDLRARILRRKSALAKQQAPEKTAKPETRSASRSICALWDPPQGVLVPKYCEAGGSTDNSRLLSMETLLEAICFILEG